MAKKKDMEEGKKVEVVSSKKTEAIGVLFISLATYFLLALVSFHLKPSAANWGGPFGGNIAGVFVSLFGYVSYVLPTIMLVSGFAMAARVSMRCSWLGILSGATLLMSVAGMASLLFGEYGWWNISARASGGLTGDGLSMVLVSHFNVWGAMIIFLFVSVVTTMLTTTLSPWGAATKFGQISLSASAWVSSTIASAFRRFFLYLTDALRKFKERERRPKPVKQEVKRDVVAPFEAPSSRPLKVVQEVTDVDQIPVDFTYDDAEYYPPGIDLLENPPPREAGFDRSLLEKNARLLETKLQDFGVRGEVTEVKPGPIVTMYEFAPAPGVKVNKIANLSDDLAMALKAISIRIVAPIPGKGVVGIEIPNSTREMVMLKEVIASQGFADAKKSLPLALGKDIFGHTVTADLAKMPHLLVAGSTGSGKSVAINAMILSLLYRYSPKDIRMIMVDPKMLELSVYDGIPHLLLPVVTDPRKASMALNWAVREMDRRYALLADKGVRGIDGYNAKLAAEEPVLDLVEEVDEDAVIEEGMEHGHLPRIVLIVDELADLMMVAGRDLEESIARLAQKARAAGIHLILATQRPSVDVITGLIKANFPARISFKVFSKTDSRTILDQMGADSLLGSGDMLFLSPENGILNRVHGAFVGDAEVLKVASHLKEQGLPEYDETILEVPEEGGGVSGGGEDVDELYPQALSIVAKTQSGSISMIQRRLKIGYNRAARIVEQMEVDGIIDPSDGTGKPRAVNLANIPSNYLEEAE